MLKRRSFWPLYALLTLSLLVGGLFAGEIGRLKAHFNSMVEGLQERERIRETFGR